MEEWSRCRGYQEEKALISLEDSRKALPVNTCPGKCFLFIPVPRNRLPLDRKVACYIGMKDGEWPSWG